MPDVTITIPGTDYVEIPLPKTEMAQEEIRVEWLNMTKVMNAYIRDESGDAELFAELFRDKVVFDHSERKWYLFGTHCWKADRTKQVKHLVSNQVAAQYLKAAAELKALGLEGSHDRVKDLQKRASSLGSANRINSVLELASIQEGIALTGDEWHKDPLLLACPNGVISLRDGFSFRDGKPGDYLRTEIPTEWKGINEPAPRWEKFLEEIFSGDMQVVEFVRRLFGYGLTGLAVDDRFPVLWGEGRNGKDTLIETIEQILGGGLASPVTSEVVVSTDRNPSAATPHLIAMRNRRLVWVSETNQGARINAGQVKMLTGGGTIAARPLYGQATEFKPTHLLILMTNYKPHAGDDEAIWKRLLLIEFKQKFVDDPVLPNEHKKDGFLSEKLLEERSGILAWFVRGALEWMELGMEPPQSVLDATKEYRSYEDIMHHFRNDCLDLGDYETPFSSLYEFYREWSEESGFGKPMSKIAFGERLTKMFGKRYGMRGAIYIGCKLKSI